MTCVKRSPSHPDKLPSQELHLVLILDLDLLIKRENYSRIDVVLVKLDRKSSDYVSEASYLNKGANLR